MILNLTRIFSLLFLMSLSQLVSANNLPLFVANVETAGTASGRITESWIKEIDSTTLSELQLDQVDSITVIYSGNTFSFDKTDRYLVTEGEPPSAPVASYFRWLGLTTNSERLKLTVQDGVVTGEIIANGEKTKLQPTGNTNEVSVDVFGS